MRKPVGLQTSTGGCQNGPHAESDMHGHDQRGAVHSHIPLLFLIVLIYKAASWHRHELHPM